MRHCTISGAVMISVIAASLFSSTAIADHERRGGFRGGGKIAYGAVSYLPLWFGIDGIALSLGEGFDEADTGLAPRPLGFRVRSGADVSRRLGVEVHAGFGSDRRTESVDRFDTWVVGGFLRGGLPLGPAAQLNGLFGLGTASVSQRVDNGQFRDQVSGLAWGINLDVKLSPRTSLTGGWTRYANGDAAFAAISGWSLGLRVGFY